jgi:micrococcal nuclease
MDLYVFRARVLRVVDGDTLDVELDLGFDTYARKRARLLGVNTPEMKGATYTAGKAATDHVALWCRITELGASDRAWPFLVQSHRVDAFGRILATVFDADDPDVSLNEDLLRTGRAAPFLE